VPLVEALPEYRERFQALYADVVGLVTRSKEADR
jgi:hypothetical protein